MTKQCIQCSKTFTIDHTDQEFYRRLDVPPPTLCPDCRQQRRLAWRNERKLYQGRCQLCQQVMVSLYHPGSPYTVYCQDCWWSDAWPVRNASLGSASKAGGDPLQYGRPFDFSQPFFEQYCSYNYKFHA